MESRLRPQHDEAILNIHGSNRTTTAASRRASTLLRSKTRSRFTDPSPPPPTSAEEDEDDVDDDDPLNEDRRRWASCFRPSSFLQWFSLLLLLGFLASALSIPALRRRTLWSLHLWRWSVLALALVSGRLVSGWGVRLAVFSLERHFLLRRRVLYFVYGVRHAVKNSLWLALVLLAWHLTFDGVEGAALPPIIAKILLCILVATLFRLAKTLLVKTLASSFHVGAYFDRIQDSLFNQYVIETLSGPPLIDGNRPAVSFRRSQKEEEEEEEGITMEKLRRLSRRNVSAWNMKRLMKIVRHGTLSTLDESIPKAGVKDEAGTQIQSECEAKVAAKKIFNNVAQPGSRYIYLIDLMHFMREEEALKAISFFEGEQEDNNKGVSKKALKIWVLNAFRERKALSLTLNDTKTAVKKLHQMATVIVGIIVFAIWLIILDIATTHMFVFISSQLLVVAFVFGNTLKMVFEAIVFLFVMHPFDVGDRCEVEGVQMIVEEMNILTTIFLRYDNQKITYPNSVLATMPISNIYRSPDMGDAIDFCVHVSTPVEKLALVKERITKFIEARKDHWYPNPSVVLKDVEDMNRLKISVWLRHRCNHQDMGQRWARRELVVQEMIKVFREFDIEYRMLPLEVSVRNMPALPSIRLPSTWTTCS